MRLDFFEACHSWRIVGDWIASLESKLDSSEVWAEVSDWFFRVVGVF
jgi:hypothetical protein